MDVEGGVRRRVKCCPFLPAYLDQCLSPSLSLALFLCLKQPVGDNRYTQNWLKLKSSFLFTSAYDMYANACCSNHLLTKTTALIKWQCNPLTFSDHSLWFTDTVLFVINAPGREIFQKRGGVYQRWSFWYKSNQEMWILMLKKLNKVDILVSDWFSHQIYYHDCKLWLINLYYSYPC